jgi:hypothetical protein
VIAVAPELSLDGSGDVSTSPGPGASTNGIAGTSTGCFIGAREGVIAVAPELSLDGSGDVSTSAGPGVSTNGIAGTSTGCFGSTIAV